MSAPKPDLTRLFRQHEEGDPKALNELANHVFAELRQIARRCMAREHGARTLQPTALVNEAFLRLFQGTTPSWESRAHFYNMAARLMRRILIDEARKRHAQKRGEGPQVVSFDELVHSPDLLDVGETDILALDKALTKLEQVDQRLSRVVELRYFAGLDIEETAATLQCSTGTVKRDWVKAKLWFLNELGEK